MDNDKSDDSSSGQSQSERYDSRPSLPYVSLAFLIAALAAVAFFVLGYQLLDRWILPAFDRWFAQ